MKWLKIINEEGENEKPMKEEKMMKKGRRESGGNNEIMTSIPAIIILTIGIYYSDTVSCSYSIVDIVYSDDVILYNTMIVATIQSDVPFDTTFYDCYWLLFSIHRIVTGIHFDTSWYHSVFIRPRGDIFWW